MCVCVGGGGGVHVCVCASTSGARKVSNKGKNCILSDTKSGTLALV